MLINKFIWYFNINQNKHQMDSSYLGYKKQQWTTKPKTTKVDASYHWKSNKKIINANASIKFSVNILILTKVLSVYIVIVIILKILPLKNDNFKIRNNKSKIDLKNDSRYVYYTVFILLNHPYTGFTPCENLPTFEKL